MNMLNGDEAMSPAEFAKLMGAYPQPAENPLPAYGGYMDNSPANFAWVNNNAYFGAEGGRHKLPLNISIDTSASTMDGFSHSSQEGFNKSYRKMAIDAIKQLNPPHVVILDHNRTVETVYEGDAQGAIQFINDERNLQPRNGTASMGSIVEAISTLHGHKMILTDGDWVSVESAIRMAEGEKKNCGCGQDPCITYGAETFEAPYGGAGSLMDIGKETPLADFTGQELAESSAIHGDFDQASLNYSGHQNLEVRAEDEMTRMQVSIGCPSGSTKDFTKIFDVNARGSDLEYLTSDLEDEVKSRVASWNETYEAEMEELTENMVEVTNRFDDSVGRIHVEDVEGDIDDIESVDVSLEDMDGDMIASFTMSDEYIPEELDDYLQDQYATETKKGMWVGLASLAIGTLAWLNRDSLTSSVKRVFNNETQEMLENDPELIENPEIGNLDPAQYEELVVQSTGYAVDVIPVGLDGSFMGSRFAALPTERYVEYNDPGIGAHTDIAMNRDEIYLEPEMAMVQASENVIKEAQAPGQSPYNSITGEENPDFDYRVIKETHPISLDPAVKPFIPQSMAGYTGNANTPPSVMNKMFNIGVLGQTPAFVPGSSDMGANHFGSRNATPNTLGLGGVVGGPLSDQVNASYTDGTTSMSLAQWSIENTVSQTSDTEAVVIDRSSGLMKRVRRV